MESKHTRRDLKILWRDQPTEDRPVTLDNIRKNADVFQTQIRRRNRREIAAAGVVLLVFGFYSWVLPGWMIKTGSLLVMVGTLWIVWQLRRRASADSTKPAFNHCFRIRLSTGTCASSQSWLMLSKHPLISPSRTHLDECRRSNTFLH